MMRATGTQRTPMLSVDDVAELLNVSTKTVRRWLQDGRLSCHRFGRQIRISAEALDAFIRQNRE
jgi:excisionase family DNA binding protein